MVLFIFVDGDNWLRSLSIKDSFLSHVLQIEDITSLHHFHNPTYNNHSTSQTMMSVTCFTHPQSWPLYRVARSSTKLDQLHPHTQPHSQSQRLYYFTNLELKSSCTPKTLTPSTQTPIPGTKRNPNQCSKDTKTLKIYTQSEAPRCKVSTMSFFGTPLKGSDERYTVGLRGRVQNLPHHCNPSEPSCEPLDTDTKRGYDETKCTPPPLHLFPQPFPKTISAKNSERRNNSNRKLIQQQTI